MTKKKKRKSPYKHTVKDHIRSGRQVKNYLRGKGNKTAVTKKFSLGSSPYIVKVTYLDRSSETVDVSPSKKRDVTTVFRNALNIGVELRRYIKPPIIVSVRRRRT